MKDFVLSLLGACGVSLMLLFYGKEEKPFFTAFVHFVISTIGLFACQGLMMLLGHGFSINLFTSFIALTLGLPGIAGMMIFLLLF